METFAWSFVSYWIGWFVYRSVYKARLARLVEAQRAVMDTVFDQVDDPASLLPYCSDGLVRGVVLQAASESALRRVAIEVLRRRGLEIPQHEREV